MDRLARRALALVALLALTLIVAACGDDEGDSGGSAAEKGATGEVKQGGSVTISQTSQPDFLDPALSYTVNGWEPMWIVYTPLLTYRHAEGQEGAELIPGLAEAMPTVSEDGRTYELKLRDGLKFADGTAVKASDFEHTIKRVLNLESGGSPFYLGIVGAEEYVKNKKAEADIEGIETDDATGQITINLNEPDGTFANVLAMNFAGLVPSDTPFENRTKNPPPGVGAYTITRSVPNREFVMEKNEHFPGFEGVPEGNIETITTKIVKSPQRQAQNVISGTFDYMQDPPPADLKPTVKEKYADRYKEYTTNSTYYFFMNHRVAPFDDPKVREAVNHGINKPGLARIFAGELETGCNFLPPGMPGYEKIEPCPYGDPSQPPDIEKARQLIREAGAEGTKVTVWGNNDDPTPKVTAAYADMLNDIGLEAEPKILDGGVYFQTVGNQKTKAQTGFTNWFQDFPHPANFMFLVNGKTIQPTNNQNFGNVDDPEVNKAIDRLTTIADLEQTVDEWAAVDRELVEEAHIAPYGHRKLATFMSDKMNFEECSLVHPVYQNDYSSWCLK